MFVKQSDRNAAQEKTVYYTLDNVNFKDVYKRQILNGECGMFNPLLLECLVEIQDKVRKELGIKGVNECLEYLEERN